MSKIAGKTSFNRCSGEWWSCSLGAWQCVRVDRLTAVLLLPALQRTRSVQQPATAANASLTTTHSSSTAAPPCLQVNHNALASVPASCAVCVNGVIMYAITLSFVRDVTIPRVVCSLNRMLQHGQIELTYLMLCESTSVQLLRTIH